MHLNDVVSRRQICARHEHTHRETPSHVHDVGNMLDVGRFAIICISNRKCKCQPKGNKEGKNQPIGIKIKNCFRTWNAKLRMYIVI
jgi:hypothetical protein